MFKAVPQDTQRERVDVAAVRAEFEAMMQRARESKVQ